MKREEILGYLRKALKEIILRKTFVYLHSE
jgi:hypothetical protein